mmetsp:Transcript_12194/g.12608  ORF Transcript_12194/g.12608 Transcript_12194/m.12608 type:complete len:86 (+) Transcript_12194:936-1193(+)
MYIATITRSTQLERAEISSSLDLIRKVSRCLGSKFPDFFMRIEVSVIKKVKLLNRLKKESEIISELPRARPKISSISTAKIQTPP